MNQDPILQSRMNNWQQMRQNPFFHQAYEKSEKASIKNSVKWDSQNDAIIEEFKIGFVEGYIEGITQMIHKAYEFGVSLETIAKASEISIEEVKHILQSKS
ncbi:hypothetical protein [Bacillus cereus]|uniref:Uncharacterized protein n=1 Tax=Bacillus cereus (strain VD146) TaxID=1053236 RepID=R8ME28_BACCX|nr:hypothetical protein [Bacillus cereus]EOP32304.1 hypothetical protein IK1_05840 [Bacillus cereus VD146]